MTFVVTLIFFLFKAEATISACVDLPAPHGPMKAIKQDEFFVSELETFLTIVVYNA